MTSGRTAVKNLFPCPCPVPCPALAVLHAQYIIRYLVVLRSRTSSFACATHMYTPPRWQGPAGPPRCVPVLPMRAPGCCSSSVVLCSCSCLSVCRAPSRVVRCGSFGWCVCVTVLGVVARMVRVVRVVLWCQDAPSGVVGWARRNTPVPVGRGVGAAPCGELAALRIPLWVRHEKFGSDACDLKEEEIVQKGQAAEAQAPAAKRKSTCEEPAPKKKRTASKPQAANSGTGEDTDESDGDEEKESEEEEEE